MTDTGVSGHLNLVVALDCEARPLVRRFGLRAEERRAGFKVYSAPDMSLIVSGVGKAAVSAACGYLAGRQASTRPTSIPAWLNLGIAGHRCATIGTALLISRVSDATTGRSFYPPLLIESALATSELITVDRAEVAFVDDAAYDMEASAFCMTAGRFTSSELVQVVKVVSDNAVSGHAAITAARATALIEGQLDLLESMIRSLRLLAEEYSHLYVLPQEFHNLCDRVKPSASLAVKLEQAYRRYRAAGGSNLTVVLESESFVSARELLQEIDTLTGSL